MSSRRVTIYDIANHADLSVSTVSRVLNGSTLIPQPTRESVLTAVAELGYESRRIRRPGGRAVFNIVVVLPDSGEPPTHLFYDATALFSGIARGIGERRAHTIAALQSSTAPFEGKKLGDIDGCICAFCEPSAELRALLRARSIPAVVINRYDDEFASVVNDAAHGFATLADHIARVRPGKVAYLSVGPDRPIARYRRDAVLGTGALGIARDRCFEWESLSVITTDAIRRIVADGARTLVCMNDLVAVAVYERLLRAGVDVPGDVGLTGYDAAPVLGLVSTPITTVDLAVDRMGERAASILVAGILARESPRSCEHVAGALVVGESLGESEGERYGSTTGDRREPGNRAGNSGRARRGGPSRRDPLQRKP